MKKKTIILIIIAILISILVYDKNAKIKIPKESIRIRIIANSNESLDIKEKLVVKEKVEKELYSLLNGVSNIADARYIIENNLDRLNILIDDTTNQDYLVSFGSNYFPRKVYKGVVYEEGMYESLTITLGTGIGNNWWCVLFPPLCLLEGNENTKDVEYQFFIKELLTKYTK